MLPLSFWLLLTCQELREAELKKAAAAVVLVDRIHNPQEPKYIRDVLHEEYVRLRVELDDIDTAKGIKHCENVE